MLRLGMHQQAEHGQRLLASLVRACRHYDVLPTRFVMIVKVGCQHLWLFEKTRGRRSPCHFPRYAFSRRCLVSTSRFGIGQVSNSKRTPLGLHRVAEKIGAGEPIGTVFRGRIAVGLTWQGMPTAAIVHRIFWLEGLEPGFNRGGNVDSYSRYIYIHGFGDETTLGRPASLGCIHLAAADLLPLFDSIPVGTLVWIEA